MTETAVTTKRRSHALALPNLLTYGRCVAVPVMDFTGQTIGALGISGPIWRLSNQALHNSAKIVQTAAGRLSAEFGANGAANSS